MLKGFSSWIVLTVVSLVTIMSMSGCSPQPGKGNAEKAESVVKSPADDKEYRHLTLASGLKVLLISDPKTDTAAAAVDVGVGSFNDPDNRLGLAHFLEHMLFLGNEKYPEIDGYFKYIRANGGSANAYTASVHTNFHFDINSDKLQPALDQLAQFFVSPTLDPKYVDRERHAIDSEYKLHALADSWRISMVKDITSNPAHPKSRFSIGSLETLNNDDGVSLWKDLKSFYDRFYVAENMRLVVYGKESIGTLAKWVKLAFNSVPSNASAQTTTDVKPYTANEVGVRINVEPVKDTRVLSLTFPMKSQMPYYKKKPLDYLLRLIGHEGKGSLHSFLKEKGLIISLGAFSSSGSPDFSEVIIRLKLTPAGLKQIDNITAMVFDYIKLIGEDGLREHLYLETRNIAELEFRFQERSDPLNMVSSLSSDMRHYATTHILNAHYLYEDFDEKLIRSFLNEMKPENLRQVVIARGLDTDKVEPYFDTRYKVQPLSDSLLKRLKKPQKHAELAMPAANAFIATDIVLRGPDKNETNKPEHIIQQPGFDVWAMTDTSFDMPKATVCIKVSTPLASKSTEHIDLMKIYQSLLTRSLNEYGYAAGEAGLFYAISGGREGLTITLSGYQDKQSLLLNTILMGIKQFSPNEKDFEEEREQLVTALKNKMFDPPYYIADNAIYQVLYPNYPSNDALLEASQSLTFDSLKVFIGKFYNAIHIDMLVHGNHSRKEAASLTDIVKNALLTADNRSNKYVEPFSVLADQRRILEIDIKHNDSIFAAYFQRPEIDNHSRAHYALLVRLLATPFFKSLRTEQQLGYVVYSGAKPIEKHPGVIFMVQSPEVDPLIIEEKLRIFLKEQADRIQKLTDADLDEYRQGLIGLLLKRDANLDERSSRFWFDIVTDESFDNRKQIAEAVRKTTVADIQQQMATLLEGKGQLIVRSFGKKHHKAKEKVKDSDVCRDLKCFDNLARG